MFTETAIQMQISNETKEKNHTSWQKFKSEKPHFLNKIQIKWRNTFLKNILSTYNHLDIISSWNLI